MAILKATIKSEVVRRTRRAEADVTDAEIAGAIQFLSMQIPALFKECTTPTVVGQPYYDLRTLPKKFRSLIVVRVEGGQNEDPLCKIGDWQEYQTLIGGETSADYDEPDRMITYDDYLYVYPTPDSADYTLRIFASVFERDADSIALDEYYSEAIYELTCYETLKNKGLGQSKEAQDHLQNFARWQGAHSDLQNEKTSPETTAYTDI